MPKKYMIYGIILAVLLLLAYLLYVFNHKKVMNQINESQNVGHFMGDGYSFDYPIFENWDVKIQSDQIRYDSKKIIGQDLSGSVVIDIKTLQFDGMPKTDRQNRNGVPYTSEILPDIVKITFLTGGAGIELAIPQKNGPYGFSGEKVREVILDSFKINK